MPANVGSAVGYLDLDISGFVNGLRTAQTEADKATSGFAASIGGGLTKVGDSMTKTGAKFSATITAPVVAAGKSILETTANFEAGMSKVSAISGATGSDLERLKEKALYMGETTKFSATEATEAFKYMSMAGWETEDMLEGIDGIMALSAADGLDLATTSDIVTDALTAFGLKASDSGHFADVLAKTSSNANTNVEMLGESFKYIAPLAGAMDYSIEDVAQALGLMANSGIKSSQAGTSLRQALSNMINPTDDAANVMKNYGLSLYDANGQALPLMNVMEQLRDKFQGIDEGAAFDEINKQLEEGTISADEWEAKMEEIYEKNDSTQLRDLADLFGVRSMPAMLSIINATEEDFDKLATAIDNADGTAQNMADTMLNNLDGQITILKSQIEGVSIKLGEILLPYAKDLVGRLQELVTWFSNLSEEQQKWVIKIAGIAAAVGPVMIVVGKLVSTFGKLASVFGGAGGSGLFAGIKQVATAFTTLNPVVAAVIAVIALLTAAFVELWNNNEGFRESMIATWESIKASFEDFVAGFKERIPEIQQAFQNIVDFVTPIWQAFCEFLAPIFEEVWAMIGTILENAFDIILNLVDIFTGIFTGNWKQVWTACKNIFNDLWNVVVTIFTTIFNRIKTIVTNIFNVVKTWATDMWNKAKEMAQTFFNNIAQFFDQLPYKIGYWIGQALGHVIQWAIDMPEKAKEMGENFIEKVTEFFVTLPDKIHTFLTDTLPKVGLWVIDMGVKGKEAIEELWNKFKKAADDLPEKLKEIGKNIVSGVWNGISSKAEEFKNNVENFFSGIVDGVKDVLGIESPSKVFAKEVGRWLPPGVANGFKQALPKAIKDMKDMLTDGIESIDVSSLSTEGLEYMPVNGTRIKRHSDVSEGNGKNKGNGGGNTFIFNSPKAIDEIEAARQVNAVERRIAEGFA